MRSRILILIGSATLLVLALMAIPVTSHTTENYHPQMPMPPLPPPPEGRLGISTVPQPDFGIQAIGNPIPRKGDQKLLVILADFPDKAGIFTGQAWRQFFWGAGGFADYFKEISYNQLRYTTIGDVVGISGTVPVTNSVSVAYVRMPNPITYYADGSFGFYGQFPRNNAGVVYNALQALDTAGFDFSPYANPTTKEVENLIVIFAGRSHGYTRDPVNSLEATAYSLTDAAGSKYTSQGGQTFDNYTFCPEQTNYPGYPDQIARIGICMHEHGHALGIPDLYDLSYTTSGVGKFDSMGYGLYGATDGLRPFHLSTFSKEFAGWITPTVFLSGTYVITLGPAEAGANFIKLYPHSDPSSNEYFLLENRQPLGFDQDWQSVNLCAGLVIWHVDQNIVQNYSDSDTVNTLASAGGPPHQGVIVVEADGRFDMIKPPPNYGECSDTWTVGRTWDNTSTPNSRLWSGADSKLSVSVLSADSGSVTLGITVQALTIRSYLPMIPKQH
jgi:immune inhibitor A